MKRLFIALSLLTLTLWGTHATAAGRQESLADIEALYGAGDYDTASKKIDELLVRDAEIPAGARARIYLMKARIETAYGRPSETRLWLSKAHAANPTLALDPVKDPPALITMWNDLKGQPTSKDSVSGDVGYSTGHGRFILGLLPLGIGHFDAGRYKDGALFLSSEGLTLLSGSSLARDGDSDTQHRARLLSTTTFLGVYGYELFDLLPDLRQRDADWASGLRTTLSIFPFGVGQAKNGETTKALAFAAIDSVLLSVATLAPNAPQQHAALGLFAVAWGYGIADAIVNQRPDKAAADVGRQNGFLTVLPWSNGKHLGFEMEVALK